MKELRRILTVSSGMVGPRLDTLKAVPEGERFLGEYEAFAAEHGDLAFQKTYLKERSDLFLKNILALADSSQGSHDRGKVGTQKQCRTVKLERDLIALAEAPQEALEFLRIARLSWRFRDDDNILMGRLEGQLLRAVELGRTRQEELKTEDKALELREALRELLADLDKKESKIKSPGLPPQMSATGETPRQLVGQPAAPGLGKGKARCIRGPEDLGDFAAGEILVCDAIQPTMTHLVPLAAGVVERRGGMLIHGAIIARELGIPCVNGVRDVALLQSGELLTVDGYLGIVTVGEATLDLERYG